MCSHVEYVGVLVIPCLFHLLILTALAPFLLARPSTPQCCSMHGYRPATSRSIFAACWSQYGISLTRCVAQHRHCTPAAVIPSQRAIAFMSPAPLVCPVLLAWPRAGRSTTHCPFHRLFSRPDAWIWRLFSNAKSYNRTIRPWPVTHHLPYRIQRPAIHESSTVPSF